MARVKSTDKAETNKRATKRAIVSAKEHLHKDEKTNASHKHIHTLPHTFQNVTTQAQTHKQHTLAHTSTFRYLFSISFPLISFFSQSTKWTLLIRSETKKRTMRTTTSFTTYLKQPATTLFFLFIVSVIFSLLLYWLSFFIWSFSPPFLFSVFVFIWLRFLFLIIQFLSFIFFFLNLCTLFTTLVQTILANCKMQLKLNFCYCYFLPAVHQELLWSKMIKFTATTTYEMSSAMFVETSYLVCCFFGKTVLLLHFLLPPTTNLPRLILSTSKNALFSSYCCFVTLSFAV